MTADELIHISHTSTLLAREFPHLDKEQIASLFILARKLHRLAVAYCNTGLTERQKRAYSKMSLALVNTLPGHITVDGDPRGYVVKVKLPSGKSNNLGEDWGIA